MRAVVRPIFKKRLICILDSHRGVLNVSMITKLLSGLV